MVKLKGKPMSRLPVMMMGLFFTLVGSGVPSIQKYSYAIGAVMFITSYGVFQNGMFLGSLRRLSLLSIATLLLFFSGIFLGVSFIIGNYSLFGFVIEKEYSFIVGLLLIICSSVATVTGDVA